jgi:bacterioferritin
MKGSDKVISKLNTILAEEHSAYVQYITHGLMCKNNGYEKLAEYILKRAADEKEHAKELIERILFIGGVPLFAEIAPVIVGNTVIEMFPNDQKSEINAIASYSELIDLTVAEKDFGTRRLAEHILEEEETHLNDIESNITQIINSGIDNYLVAKI